MQYLDISSFFILLSGSIRGPSEVDDAADPRVHEPTCGPEAERVWHTRV